MRLVEEAARHPVFANLLMAATVFGGVWGFTHMRAELFPDVATDQAVVTLPYPGASAEEVEDGVILRIEEALEGLEGIDDVLSVARESVASVTVELEEASPEERRAVIADIKDRVDGVQGLPDSVEEPVVKELLIELPAALLVLHGPVSERTLRELAYRVKDDLRAQGIAQVHLSGLRDYEIAIEVGREALQAHGLTLGDVARVVGSSSLNLPAGSLRTHEEELKVEVRGRRKQGRDYRDLVVSARPDGTVVRLGELARIVDGFEEEGVRGHYEGERACFIQINSADGDDTIAIARQATEYAASVELPEGVELVVLGDFSVDIVDRIRLLLENGWQGLLLLFCCLLLLLNLRLSLWVAAGIPVAFACAGVIVWGAGHSLNMINLFGLILVLGIVVDDAIVVGENVFAHRERGAGPLQAAVAGAREVSWPVLAGVSTTIVAFVPLFFVDGVMGRFIEQMPLIVIATLVGSLVESLLILPNHLAHMRHEAPPPERTSLGARIRGGLNRCFAAVVERAYLPALRLALRQRVSALALAIAALFLGAGLVVGGFAKFVMLPKEDSVYVQVDMSFPAGTPAARTAAALERLEETGRAVDARLGAGGPGPFLGIYSEVGGTNNEEHVGRVVAALRPAEARELHSEDILALWREAMGPVPGARQVRYGQFGGVLSKDVELRLRGEDTVRLEAAADALLAELAREPGVQDPSSDFLPGKRELRVELRERGRVLGLSLESLAQQVRAGFYGAEALAVQRGRDEVEVQVRYPRESRVTRADLDGLWIRTPAGGEAPFAEVAQVELTQGLAEIKRRNGRRQITLLASVDEDATTAGRVTGALEREALPRLRRAYPDVEFTVEGAAAESAESLSSLARGFLFAGIGMFAILALIFRSYLQPLLIMAAIPFGFVGALLAHMALGLPVTMLSVFGLVALAGVVVNDSLVLVDRANGHQRAGAGVVESLERAGPSRFRPILLTSLTTVSGMLPILFERSFQAQFVIPMAVSLAGGLLAATFVTLLLVPVLYLLLNDLRRIASWLRHGAWPTREAVEPGCRQGLAPGHHESS